MTSNESIVHIYRDKGCYFTESGSTGDFHKFTHSLAAAADMLGDVVAAGGGQVSGLRIQTS